MVDRGVKIGAVSNRDAVWQNTLLYPVKVLTPKESNALGYQTDWPAIIPDQNATPRRLTKAELVSLTTARATSRINPVFFRVNPDSMAKLEGLRPSFTEDTPRLTDGEVIELAPGIEARLSIIRQDHDKPTTAWSRATDNPHFPHGVSVGVHFDHGTGLPVGSREQEDRRGIVVLSSDSGPTNHGSLFIKSHNVLDVARATHPEEKGYVPSHSDLQPWLVEALSGEEEIVDVTVPTGFAIALSQWGTWHDGRPNSQQRAFTAVTYETPNRWREEDLIASSLFR